MSPCWDLHGTLQKQGLPYKTESCHHVGLRDDWSIFQALIMILLYVWTIYVIKCTFLQWFMKKIVYCLINWEMNTACRVFFVLSHIQIICPQLQDWLMFKYKKKNICMVLNLPTANTDQRDENKFRWRFPWIQYSYTNISWNINCLRSKICVLHHNCLP